MCDCHKSITDQLTERFKNATPDASDHKVELQGYGFTVTENRMELRPFMPYKAGAEYPLKKGGTKWKRQDGNMVFRFCPFCGDEFGKEKASAGVAAPALNDEQLADLVPQSALVLEKDGERNMVCMTRAQLHEFAQAVRAAGVGGTFNDQGEKL